jgi:chlorobactene glucosyltransferase
MGIGLTIWIVLLGLIGLIWLTRHLEVSRAYREQIPLRRDSFDGPPSDPPPVSVLVAFKDEEDNVELCVRTLLEQDYPNFELILINDRSKDRTPEILESFARNSNGRDVSVVHVSDLREGWFGKNNAMREGLERAKGEWLVFSDADCCQTSRRTLSMAVRQASEHKIDFLSVLPVLETPSIWERIIQPVCGAIMVFWFHPRRVNDPRSKAAYANGAFMLMTRDAYRRIGGHEVVKTEVNEDVHMARLAKEKGVRLFVMQNEGLYRVRMYTRFMDTWRGWSRIFYGCFGSLRRLMVSFLSMLIVSLIPWLSAAVGWAAVALGAGAGWTWLAVVATITVLIQQTVIFRYYRLSYANPWLAPTFPLGGLLSLGMLLNAMSKLAGMTTTTWRGTTYQGDRVALENAVDGAAPRDF